MFSVRLGSVLFLGAAGCTTLMSSPSYVGGTLAEEAPIRMAAEEKALRDQNEAALREPKSIGAKHVLVMHVDSERKPQQVTRSKAEAKKLAEEVLKKARAGVAFNDLVIEYSDEPGADDRNGDLGVFTKKEMVKAFSDAAFGLKVGEVSELVETPFGFHIIQRTE
jgi:peptidyl-prolyl cis-trans isomerase NIMA-interacting 1